MRVEIDSSPEITGKSSDQNSNLQNCEIIKGHCFKLPNLWSLLMAVIENEYKIQCNKVTGARKVGFYFQSVKIHEI